MTSRTALSWVLLLAVIVTPTLVIPGGVHGFDIPRLVLMTTTGTVLLVLSLPHVVTLWARADRPVRWLLGLAGGFAVWMVVATLTSDVPVLSVLGQDGRFVGTVAVAFPAVLVVTVPLVVRRVGDMDRALLVLAGVLSAIAAYGVVQFLGLDPMPWSVSFGGRPVATFGNSNFVGAVMCLTVPLAAWLWLRSPRTRPAAALLLLSGGVTLWAAEARLGWAAAAVGLALLLLLASSRVPERLQRGTLAASPPASVAIGIAAIGAGIALQDVTSLARLAYWRAALPMWTDNPGVGVGLGRFGAFHRQYRPPASVMEAGRDIPVDSSHLWVLDLAATTGTPGALLWLATLTAAGVVLLGAWQRSRTRRAHLQVVVLASLLAAHGVQSSISVPTVVPVWIGWLLLGGVVAVGVVEPDRAKAARRPRGSRAAATARRSGAGQRSKVEVAALVAAVVLGGVAFALSVPLALSARDAGRALSMPPEVRQAQGTVLLTAASDRTPWWPQPWQELATVALAADDEDLAVHAVDGALQAEPQSQRSVGLAVDVVARWQGAAAAEPWILRLRELDPVGLDSNLNVAAWGVASGDLDLAADALAVAEQHVSPQLPQWDRYQDLRSRVPAG